MILIYKEIVRNHCMEVIVRKLTYTNNMTTDPDVGNTGHGDV